MKDLFISHASEDKEGIVRELVSELKKLGLDIWYDEFELKIGDSLSASIDKGLINSDFGVVILSTSFFAKNWTDYELRSLLTKELNGKKKVLLPIWHDIGKEDVLNYSLHLADKFALLSNIGAKELAFKIFSIIKPDIVNSQALIHVYREITKNSNEIKKINFSDLQENEIQHKELPKHLVISAKLIHSVFADVYGISYKDFVVGFARDVDYEKEFLIWHAMASTYIDFIKIKNLDFHDLEIKTEIYVCLLSLVSGVSVEKCYLNNRSLNFYDFENLLRLYKKNLDDLLRDYNE